MINQISKFLFVCFLVLMVPFSIHAEETGSSPTVVIMLGPPGAGKGTHAMRLKEKLHLPHISTGDLFRENIGNGTLLGMEAKAYMDTGKLAPDRLVLDMLFDRIKAEDCKDGYILDGFPRTVAQAEALDKRLAKDITMVVMSLDIPDEVIKERISRRRICSSCGITQTKKVSSDADKPCDACGGDLIQRSDDRPVVVNKRLKIYYNETAPLKSYYSDKKVLYSVDSNQPLELVFEELYSKLMGALKGTI